MSKDITQLTDDELLAMDQPPEVEEKEETEEPEQHEDDTSTEDSGSQEEESTEEDTSEEKEDETETQSEESDEEKKEEDSDPESTGSEEDKTEDEPEEKKEEVVEKKEESKDSGSEEKDSAEKQEESKQEPEKTTTINYEEFYKKVMTPFKANGKTISLQSPEEAIQLMQMGANYTRKMQAIAPYKKTLIMLENNGLLDEKKLSFYIDLDKKDPEAIKKFIKDAGIDPMEIDTTTEPKDTEGSHRVSDEEANFVTVLDDLNQSQEGKQTIQEINSTWDEASKEFLWKDPEIMHTIHQQRESGIYKTIADEVNRRKTIGSIPQNVPFLVAYKQVGDALVAQQQKAAQTIKPAAPVAVKAKVNKPVVKNTAKAKAAATVRTSTNRTVEKFINPLEMSDDEFLEKFKDRL